MPLDIFYKKVPVSLTLKFFTVNSPVEKFKDVCPESPWNSATSRYPWEIKCQHLKIVDSVLQRLNGIQGSMIKIVAINGRFLC